MGLLGVIHHSTSYENEMMTRLALINIIVLILILVVDVLVRDEETGAIMA